MFSSIVAHLTEIIPSLAHVFAPVFGGQTNTGHSSEFETEHEVSMLTETDPAAAVDGQDRRQVFVGKWDCAGTKVVNGQELPYLGHMHNLWTLDKSWLLLDFKEAQPAEGKAFAEDQYWSYTKETGIHTRPMMTSTNGFAVVTSTGWIGNMTSWSGTYDIGGVRLDLTETITILGPSQFRMFGEMFLKGTSVGSYDVTCTRKHKGHHLDTDLTV